MQYEQKFSHPSSIIKKDLILLASLFVVGLKSGSINSTVGNSFCRLSLFSLAKQPETITFFASLMALLMACLDFLSESEVTVQVLIIYISAGCPNFVNRRGSEL